MRQVPTQEITVEPEQKLVDHAQELYDKRNPEFERKEYIELIVTELLRIDVDV